MGGFSLENSRMILALAFKSNSSIRLTREDLKFFFTLDLDWFTPPEVERFIDNCRKAGLLVTKDGKTYSPGFDPAKEPSPSVGFKPNMEDFLTIPTVDGENYIPDGEDDEDEEEDEEMDYELDSDPPDEGREKVQNELPDEPMKEEREDQAVPDGETPAPNTEKKLLKRMVEHMTNNSKLEKKDVVQKINLYGRKYLLELEASALIVGAEMGIDMSEFMKDVEKAIYRRAGA